MNSIEHPDAAAMDFSFCAGCVRAELCEEMVVFPGWNFGWNLSNTNVLGDSVMTSWPCLFAVGSYTTQAMK